MQEHTPQNTLCGECGAITSDGYMVEDALWEEVASGDRFLHLACFRKRLGRDLRTSDFRDDLPINDGVLTVLAQTEGLTREPRRSYLVLTCHDHGTVASLPVLTTDGAAVRDLLAGEGVLYLEAGSHACAVALGIWHLLASAGVRYRWERLHWQDRPRNTFLEGHSLEPAKCPKPARTPGLLELNGRVWVRSEYPDVDLLTVGMEVVVEDHEGFCEQPLEGLVEDVRPDAVQVFCFGILSWVPRKHVLVPAMYRHGKWVPA